MKRKRDTAKAKVKLRGFKRSKTLVVTEYGKHGEPKPKLFNVAMQDVVDKIDNFLAPEPNMPTVDELVEIAHNGMTAKHRAEYEQWMKAQADAANNFNGTGMGIFGVDPMSGYNKAKVEYMQGLYNQRQKKEEKSDIRPKPIPTYDHKPRKIDLEW